MWEKYKSTCIQISIKPWLQLKPWSNIIEIWVIPPKFLSFYTRNGSTLLYFASLCKWTFIIYCDCKHIVFTIILVFLYKSNCIFSVSYLCSTTAIVTTRIFPVTSQGQSKYTLGTSRATSIGKSLFRSFRRKPSGYDWVDKLWYKSLPKHDGKSRKIAIKFTCQSCYGKMGYWRSHL